MRDLTFVIISKAPQNANAARTDMMGLKHVALQERFEVAEAYMVKSTPTAVRIGSDGKIASPLAIGAEAIAKLVVNYSLPGDFTPPSTRSFGTSLPLSKARNHLTNPLLGELAPSITLVDLSGKDIKLRDLIKRNTILIFWDPSCSFCRNMLADLKMLDENQGAGDTPEIIIISVLGSASADFNGFKSTVLLDLSSMAGRAFGVKGTPSAILIDREGKVASTVAAGAAELIKLMGQQATYLREEEIF